MVLTLSQQFVGVIRIRLSGDLIENLHNALLQFLPLEHREKKQWFLDGYFEMVERLQPTQIIFYGRVPDECKGNIVHIKQFSEKWNEAEVAQW